MKLQAKQRLQADVATFRTKLKELGVAPDVIDSLTAVWHVGEMMTDPSAQAYARNLEVALDDYGLEGLKSQIMYFLLNARKWQGDRARFHKKLLNKWSYSK